MVIYMKSCLSHSFAIAHQMQGVFHFIFKIIHFYLRETACNWFGILLLLLLLSLLLLGELCACVQSTIGKKVW